MKKHQQQNNYKKLMFKIHDCFEIEWTQKINIWTGQIKSQNKLTDDHIKLTDS